MPPRVSPQYSYLVGSESMVTSIVLIAVAGCRKELTTWKVTGYSALVFAAGAGVPCAGFGDGAVDALEADAAAASACRVVSASDARATATKSAMNATPRFARERECELGG